MIYRKGYVDGCFGQMHFHSAYPGTGDSDKTPIVFFHQNPKSSEDYRPLLEVLGQDRLAYAIDTPGYGESEAPDTPPSMAAYSRAMSDALDALGFGEDGKGQVDVFGFHTGVLFAAELAITRPDLVRRVVYAGIPYLPIEEREATLASLPREFELPEDGSFVMQRWDLVVIKRAAGVSVERAARVFVEDMHSLSRFWYAYDAVWRYPLEARLPLVTQPTLILQPHEMLLEHSRQAKRDLLPDADLIELPEIIDDVFDTGPQEIATALVEWLDAETADRDTNRSS